MAKRIFLALPISKPLQQLVWQWQQAHKVLPVRWTAPKNLHITLVPPWQESNIDNVLHKLRRASIAMPTFPVNFDRVGLGPDPKMPRLIWASGTTPPQLLQLKQQIESILELPRDSRPLKLHLTLARFRLENYQSFPKKHLNETITWQEQISSFVLLESRSVSIGSDYEVIEKFLL